MRYVTASGVIFQDKDFSKKCWTHGLDMLVDLANLKATLLADAALAPALSGYWGVAKDWKETSRYEQKSQAEAQALYVAITHDAEGVMQWVRIHW